MSFYSREPNYNPLWSRGATAYSIDDHYLQYEGETLSPHPTGIQGFGFEVIPEEVTVSPGVAERHAEGALLSWKVGKVASASRSALNLSTRSSDIDLKEFIMQRGGHQPEGLHKAAAQGDRAGIMHLMKLQGPDAAINQLDANGCTPLMYAVMADSKLAIEMLLNFGTKREQTDPEGRTAVHYAAFFGKHRSLKFLIESASDWTPKDIYGCTPLHWCCANKSPRSLIVLLKHAQVVMGNINQQDSEGMTPLHCAAHYCRPRHIILMNEAECDFSAVDIEEKTALHWTASNPDASCIQALVDAYPSLLNKKDVNGSTLLHLTAANGSTHLVDALLRIEGIEIDAKDNLDRTALHLACAEGHSQIVQLLLEFRALDSCVDSQGLTALHYAVQNNSHFSLQVFARLPEITHLPDNDGRTPLMVAALSGFDRALRVLLRNSVIAKSVDQVDSNGRAALHLAGQSDSASCITLLLASGADPNLQDSLQQTALFPACEGGHTSCIQSLVAGGCHPDTHDVDGHAALHRAVLCGQQDSVQGLVLAGADLNIQDGSNNTAAHMAAYSGNGRILSLLLENSANPNSQDSNGMSPVHLAAMEGHTNCLTTLLRFHAYTNYMDFSEERYTPLDYAKLHNQDACVDILTNSGGVTAQTIKEMAAISIQSMYRGHRARVLRSKLSLESHAVTVIAAHFRGYWHRKRYTELKRRHYAAIKIQAFTRGSLQGIKFRRQLARYREQERNRKLLEDYGRRVMSDREASILQAITAKISRPEILTTEEDRPGKEELDVVEEKSERELKEEESKEQRMRLEASMKMREIYEEKQKHWQEFREAERQRRVDKATQEELDRLAGILARSKARREYSNAKFQQMVTIRSYYDAAVVIQRTFRRMKSMRSHQREQELKEEAQRRKKANKAACIIQKAWRSYKQYRLYQAMHFKSIMTSPVIALPARPKVPSPPYGQVKGVPSYERATVITGNPKRQVHRTEQSCFQVFRPTTRDLLLGPIHPSRELESAVSRPDTNLIQGLSPRRSQPTIAMGFSISKEETTKDRGTKKQRYLLPQLFPTSPSKRPKAKRDDKVASFHLQEIVQL